MNSFQKEEEEEEIDSIDKEKKREEEGDFMFSSLQRSISNSFSNHIDLLFQEFQFIKSQLKEEEEDGCCCLVEDVIKLKNISSFQFLSSSSHIEDDYIIKFKLIISHHQSSNSSSIKFTMFDLSH